jgi:hypothetical protein
LTLTGVTVQNNAACGASSGGLGAGGGIYVSGGTANLSNCTVSNNTALGGGSANDSSLLINSLDAAGGGIYISSGMVSVSNCSVSYNTAQGVGLYYINSAFVTDSWDTGYDGAGGGIYISSGTVSLSNCSVSNNTAEGQGSLDTRKWAPAFFFFGQGIGGALCIESGTLTMLGCTVEHNTTVVSQNTDVLGYQDAVIQIDGGSVCMDAYTVAHVVHNTPNFIDGSYTIC